MSEISVLAEFLGISPTAVSKRLAFVKKSIFDEYWHICDHQFAEEFQGDIFLMALHEGFIPNETHIRKNIVADCLSSVALQTISTVKICSECVEEFRECLPDIQKNPTTAFVEFRQVLAESRSDDTIGGNPPPLIQK